MRTKNSIYNMIAGVLYLAGHTLFSFLITAIIIKFFGSVENGMIASIKQLSSYAAILDGGFGSACIISYYGPLARGDESAVREVFYASKRFYRLIGKLYFVALVISGILFAVFKGGYLGPGYTFFLIIAVGGGIGLQYLFIEHYKTIIIADQKNRYVQILLLLGELIYFFAAFILVVILNVKNLLLFEALNLLGVGIQMIFCRRFVKRNYNYLSVPSYGAPSVSMDSIKQKKETLVYAITTHISYNTDIIILTIFRSFSEVSIYSVYNMIISVVNYVFGILTNAVSSSFGNLYQENDDRFNDIFNAYEWVCLLLNTVLSISILFVIRAFIQFYTNGSEMNYWNQQIAFMFIINVFINNIRSPYSIIIKISESYDKTQKIFVLEAIMNICVSILLVARMGIVGVLLGTFFSAQLRNLFIINLVCSDILKISVKRKMIKIWANMCFVLGAAILASAIPDIQFNSFGRFIACGLISFVCSLFIIVMLNCLIDFKQCKAVCKIIGSYMKANIGMGGE